MKIKFRYAWYDDDKTTLCYTAEADWNWRDWHAGWRPATFSLIQHTGNVHVVIDFREQTRDKMPAGINAHFMSFGTSISQKLSGKAVVIGLPEDVKAQLMLDERLRFPLVSQHLVNQREALLQLLVPGTACSLHSVWQRV